MAVRIEFYEDPESGEPHIFHHNVSEADVEDVLIKPIIEYGGVGGVRIALGQTSAGRYLKVVYTAMDEVAFVVTAYDLSAGAKRALRRNMRRKP